MKMRGKIERVLRDLGGAVLAAAMLWLALAAPRLLADDASTAPAHRQEAHQ